MSSPPNQNGFVGSPENVVGTAVHETASRTRERGNYVRTIDGYASTERRLNRSITSAEGRGWTAFRRPGRSDESKCQKAGAEQGNPAGSQRKEAVGHKISISHDTPSDL